MATNHELSISDIQEYTPYNGAYTEAWFHIQPPIQPSAILYRAATGEQWDDTPGHISFDHVVTTEDETVLRLTAKGVTQDAIARVGERMLVGLNNTALLPRLYREHDPMVFPVKEISFGPHV